MVKLKEKKIKEVGLRPDEVHAPFIKKIYRYLSLFIAKRLVKTDITPNQVTILGFLILLLSAYFFFRGDYFSLIIAAVLLQIGFVMDYVDGSLARMKNESSNYGGWLDYLVGVYTSIILYIGIIFGIYNKIQQPHILIFGLLAVSGALIRGGSQKVYLTKFKFANKFGQEKYKKLGFLMFFRPTSPFTKTIISIGAVLNQMYWVLIFLGVYNPLYSIIQNALFTLKARKEYLKGKKV